ncbi:MAG: RAMP superfamily CRISPR-associated protein [Chloroflexota bacterium]|nr:RAMP superfamily CRISPR-associated protein [Chloroflexota bacterium]
MILKGQLYAESPIYRGNARKTLFTRDGDGTQRLVSLAGEIEGTAQSLMDAFIGQSRNGKNLGLLNRMWARLYDSPLPKGLITKVECKLQEGSYPRDHFFDLRMGIKLDEDRWAAEANANYKMETLLRNSVFDFTLHVNEAVLKKGENETRLYYILRELQEARFWFGAGKSKGLGRVRLEMDLPFSPAETPPSLHPGTNHLRILLTFDATNPVLVGWNWGKVDPDVPSFAAIEGRLLVEAMRDLPAPIRERLEMGLAGPILSPEDWKQKFAGYLPRVVAIWLRERSIGEVETWVLPAKAASKLGKGKYGLAKKLLAQIQPLVDQPFPSKEAADVAFREALEDKANVAKRILKVMVQQRRASHQLDREAWLEIANSLGLDVTLADHLAEQIQSEDGLVKILTPACQNIFPQLYQQIDQQINLIQSDAWVDVEIATREEHLRIKNMLLRGEIEEYQWGEPDLVPKGIRPATWREFIDAHQRVKFRHMLHPRNLHKSITNDENMIAFLDAYRDRTRQELAQPHHVDFRAGGVSNREISRKYGKPYDTVFMRMLSWSPSSQEQGTWEIFIPGSTIKGAFRKRATQVLKTLWGESAKTTRVLNSLFGAQRQRGLAFFSDAYLTDPYDPERAWCSMDGVKMNPRTGQPVKAAKHDYLFAYGDQLTFQLQVDVQDIADQDLEAISLLIHLLQDFQKGDIPLGGDKTSGFGWVQANVSRLTWLTAAPDGVGEKLFGKQTLSQDGVWQRLDFEGAAAAEALQSIYPLVPDQAQVSTKPPRASTGFISHRAFGGYCGTLAVEAEVLTPLNIRESGEPSFRAILADGPVNGWDFFSMAPPDADRRGPDKVYALPSRSIKGMLRHVYTIASDSREQSTDISRLNPADGLFGWVGAGPNQAIMGRVSFSFGLFEKPELAWFKVPYPYGEWRYTGNEWKHTPDSPAAKMLVAKTWRVFPHAPLAPITKRLDDFQPDTFQARYFRAVLPDARARFTIRFWNLDEREMQRLMWCVALEPGLAHKMGNNRYLGFGSLCLHVLPDSFLIDWTKRYAGESEQSWRLPIRVDEWINPDVIEHQTALRRALNVKQL